MSMQLAEATEVYQAQLETARVHPDNEEVQEDLAKSKVNLTIAWLHHTTETT